MKKKKNLSFTMHSLEALAAVNSNSMIKLNGIPIDHFKKNVYCTSINEQRDLSDVLDAL